MMGDRLVSDFPIDAMAQLFFMPPQKSPAEADTVGGEGAVAEIRFVSPTDSSRSRVDSNHWSTELISDIPSIYAISLVKASSHIS